MTFEKLGKTGMRMIGPLKPRSDHEIIMQLITQYALHEVLIKKLQKQIEELQLQK